MANKILFSNRQKRIGAPKRLSAPSSRAPKRPKARPDTVNKSGGQAYSLSDAHTLAQFAVTGTFHGTFHVSAREQLDTVKRLAAKCDPRFIASLAVYARHEGKMKDVPAFLVAWLFAHRHTRLFERVFDYVINDVKTLLAFVKMIRENDELPRNSFGTVGKRAIRNWIERRSGKQLYLASVGHQNPSLADVIRMVHPQPHNAEQGAAIAYILDGKSSQNGFLMVNGKETNNSWSDLPEDLRLLDMWKDGYRDYQLPDLPFRCLTNLDLTVDDWREIAMNMPHNTLRQNLNQLARKGVLSDIRTANYVAEKLSDRDSIIRSKALPYSLLATYKYLDTMPYESLIKSSIESAMNIASENVPALSGNVLVAIDVSASMSWPITGRKPNGSKIRCRDVAALMATCLLRKNHNTRVIAFDANNNLWLHKSRISNVGMGGVYAPKISANNRVFANVEELSRFGGGGTDVSLPFLYAIKNGLHVDTFILISDNESWCGRGANAGAQAAWETLSTRNRKIRLDKSKLINIDIAPNSTTQTPDRHGQVLNIGGFSDTVWTIIDNFVNGRGNTNFVEIISDYFPVN